MYRRYTPDLTLWERNSRLEFDEPTHRYYVDKIMCSLSVTKIIHAPFPMFDKQKALAHMRPATRLAKYDTLSDDQIFTKWAQKSSASSSIGTRMHKAIEHYFLKGTISDDPDIAPEMGQFKDFIARVLKIHEITAVAVEISIFCEPRNKIDLAGQFDFLGRDNKNELCIMDWKRCETLKLSVNGHFGYGAGVCAGEENVNFIHYSLQLHVYRHMLEKYYDIVVHPNQIYIVVFHRRNTNYQIVTAKNLSKIAAGFLGENYAELSRIALKNH